MSTSSTVRRSRSAAGLQGAKASSEAVGNTWQVQEARARFSTLIDAAMAGRPQRIRRRGRDVAVVLSTAEYDRLTAPRQDLVAFFRDSPLAEVVASGDLDPDLEREREPIRDLPL